MIRVIYRDGSEDLVTQKFLDILLFMGEVQMFRRENDWAVVGVDPIRTSSRNNISVDWDRRVHRQTELRPLALAVS
jgi:hypothetical protein